MITWCTKWTFMCINFTKWTFINLYTYTYLCIKLITFVTYKQSGINLFWTIPLSLPFWHTHITTTSSLFYLGIKDTTYRLFILDIDFLLFHHKSLYFLIYTYTDVSKFTRGPRIPYSVTFCRKTQTKLFGTSCWTEEFCTSV